MIVEQVASEKKKKRSETTRNVGCEYCDDCFTCPYWRFKDDVPKRLFEVWVSELKKATEVLV